MGSFGGGRLPHAAGHTTRAGGTTILGRANHSLDLIECWQFLDGAAGFRRGGGRQGTVVGYRGDLAGLLLLEVPSMQFLLFGMCGGAAALLIRQGRSGAEGFEDFLARGSERLEGVEELVGVPLPHGVLKSFGKVTQVVSLAFGDTAAKWLEQSPVPIYCLFEVISCPEHPVVS